MGWFCFLVEHFMISSISSLLDGWGGGLIFFPRTLFVPLLPSSSSSAFPAYLSLFF